MEKQISYSSDGIRIEGLLHHGSKKGVVVKKLLAGWNSGARFEILQGADHFYAGYLDALTAVIDKQIRHHN